MSLILGKFGTPCVSTSIVYEHDQLMPESVLDSSKIKDPMSSISTLCWCFLQRKQCGEEKK